MSDTARITASYGRHYTVRTESGQTYTATARGKRVDFACGDRVHIEVQNGEQAVIRDFLPRRSLLYRQDAWRTKLIAANVDRLFIVTAAVPSPSETGGGSGRHRSLYRTEQNRPARKRGLAGKTGLLRRLGLSVGRRQRTGKRRNPAPAAARQYQHLPRTIGHGQIHPHQRPARR